jgi:hypothetical protein
MLITEWFDEKRTVQCGISVFEYSLAFGVGWRKAMEYLDFASCKSLRYILISSWQSGFTSSQSQMVGHTCVP